MFKINDFNIDWLSKDSHWLFDESRKDAPVLAAAARKAPFYPAHIGLFSSGFQKAILISKEAILTAASGSVKHLHLDGKAKALWHAPLPFFHIAGLAVSARAFCGGFSFKTIRPWKGGGPFVQELKENKAAYTSLVPTQIYDLVYAKLAPPPSLEFALAGGDALSLNLFQKARALGWPLLPTYGMTEAASQIAAAKRSSLSSPSPDQTTEVLKSEPGRPLLPTDGMTEAASQIAAAKRSSLSSPSPDQTTEVLKSEPKERRFALPPDGPEGAPPPALAGDASAAEKPPEGGGGLNPLPVLPHIQIRVGEKGLFLLKSPALLTGWFHLESGRFEDPKDADGWFQTEDRGRLFVDKSSREEGGKQAIRLVVEGRADDQVKISGRLVSLNRLSCKLQRIAQEIFASGESAPRGCAFGELTFSGPQVNSLGKDAPRRNPAPPCNGSSETRDTESERLGTDAKGAVDASAADSRAADSSAASARTAPPRRTVCLIALPHKRKGRELVLAADFCHVKTLAEIVRRFNQEAPPAERVKSVYIVQKIPQKALFKLDRESLTKQLLGE